MTITLETARAVRARLAQEALKNPALVPLYTRAAAEVAALERAGEMAKHASENQRLQKRKATIGG